MRGCSPLTSWTFFVTKGLAGTVLALRRSARTDALTGLPNRALYGDRLAGALARLERNGGMVCVMYLDIDDFKIINDTLGHGGATRSLSSWGGDWPACCAPPIRSRALVGMSS
jgi:PleD family two-component response regulator